MRVKKYIQLIFMLCLLISSCNGKKEKGTSSKESSSFDSLLSRYYNERMHLYPLESTENGGIQYNDLLPNDLTAAFRDTQKVFYDKYRDLLSQYDVSKLNADQLTSYNTLKWTLQIESEGLKFKTYLTPISQMWSLPLSFGQLGSGQGIQPFKTVKDYEDFLKRMAAFKVWCDTAVENMREGIAIGYTNPRLIIERTLPQMNSMAVGDVKLHLFYQPIKNMPASISAADKARLDTLYQKSIKEYIIPSYKKLYDFIKDEYIQKCRTTAGIGALPEGKELYNYLIRNYTTTDLTGDSVFNIGMSEVKRIRTEMEKVKDETGYKGDLKSFFAYLNTDKKFFPYHSVNEVLDAYRKIHTTMEPQLKKFFDVVPKTKFEIRETEKFREASASVEYQGGTADGKRPGIFYVPVPDINKFNYFVMEDLFLHEAIPGHHYQISLQRENKSLPEFRKYSWNSAYGEGWALYTEYLGKELGLYKDPYQYFGYLSKQMHRAIRLVVDAGMHAKGWTREQAIQFSLDNESESKDAITVEVERYIAIPAQALSYKIGQMKILELRVKAEKELGAKFNVAKFHDAVLDGGCLPLAVLETKIDNWITEEKKK
ncbi:MAG: hypothetical protein JWN78_1977 [Bacteroidota bacterium]|nr:hypothetical protein [Bacteroidota bacterium]